MAREKVRLLCLECLQPFTTSRGNKFTLNLHCPNCNEVVSNERMGVNIRHYVEAGSRFTPYKVWKEESLQAECNLQEAETTAKQLMT